MKAKIKQATALLLAAAMCLTLAVTAFGYNDAYPNTHRNTGQHIADLIGVAKTQLGYTELSTQTGYPIAPNRDGGYTKYGASFGEPCGAWCAYFISWCASQAGIPSSVVARLGNCNSIISWYSNRSRFYYRSSGYVPKTGDLILYNWSGGTSGQHIGIVTGVSGNNVFTIEGNTGGTLGYRCEGRTRNRTASYVVGYAVPNYNDASTYVGSYSFASSVSGGSASYSDSIAYTTSKLSIVTTSATGITSSSAVLNGAVKNAGKLFVSNAGFYFGTDKLKLKKFPINISKNSASIELSMNISEKFGELKPNTTYYYRAYAAIDGRDYLGPTYAVVTVDDKPQQVVLSENKINVGIGQTLEIMAAQLPIGSRDEGMTWTSEDESIATVENGVVKGVGFGEVKVSVTTNYCSVSASCDVNVLIPYPQNIKLVNSKIDCITVQWDKVEGAKGYVIYRADYYNGDYKVVKKLRGSETEFADKNAEPGKRYYYRIMTEAPNKDYNSDLSEVVYTTARLSMPTGVAAKNQASFISVSWNKVEDASRYMVYRASAHNGLYTMVAQVREPCYLDSAVAANTPYFYKVVALAEDDKTVSEYSETVAFMSYVKESDVNGEILQNAQPSQPVREDNSARIARRYSVTNYFN